MNVFFNLYLTGTFGINYMEKIDYNHDIGDLYEFLEENEPTISSWKIFVISSDKNLYNRSNELLKEFMFHDKKLQLFYVNSLDEAKKNLNVMTDIAIALLEISKETISETVAFIKYIRDKLKSNLRIILYSNESIDGIESLFIDNDISSYLCEDQLNIDNLYATFSAGLRSYICLEKTSIEKEKHAKMLEAINRFIPQTFLKILGKKDVSEVNLTDHVEKEVAVLFFDIRGFTSLSELLTPLETFDFINNFISYLEPHISANKGYIDKYIGDSFMALFPESSDDAIKAGIAMLRSLEDYNYQRISHYQAAVKIGIGINTGEAVMGVIGFYDRMECTAISSVVNTASRLEGLTKLLGANLLISYTTFNALKNPEQFNWRSLGNIKAIGRREIVHVYEVFDADPEEIIRLKKLTKDDFEQGLVLIKNGDLIAANKIFAKIIAINSNDLPAKYYFEKTNKSLS